MQHHGLRTSSFRGRKIRINQANGADKTVTQNFSELSRSLVVISNYLQSPKTYGTHKRTGRSCNISAVACRHINCSMSKNQKSVHKISAEIPFKVSKERICRGHTHEDIFTYQRLLKTVSYTHLTLPTILLV